MTATVLDQLATVDRRLIRTAAIAGLIGGAVLAGVMAAYDATTGMGAAALFNACFAAFVFPSARMTMSDHAQMGAGSGATMGSGDSMSAMGGHHMATMNNDIVASHLAVGTLLHLAMSVTVGVVFALVLAFLLRAGLRLLTHPAAYLLAGGAGGALLYAIMMYAVAPALNPTIVDFTARAPFFWAHVAFGVVTAGYVYLRRVGARATVAAAARRPTVLISTG